MGKTAVNINSTKFGEIVINGKPYDSDMTVYWNGRLAYRGKEHVFEIGEFVKILRASPEMVVIGVGQSGGVKIAPEVRQWAENKKIRIYAENTPKAVEIFNAFANEGRKVVGVFHVTC
jgi:hypothetical protein